ncbi:hypothetical protein XENOCAPTIV_017859 [Xenoophorus captivus]|uniref:HDAg domain-containing protein n=1 Tax=Xenoophorus captivus TaxID=1517983 RepID=A0ABV0SAQ4_9TELE
MASMKDSDTGLWLHNKLGSTDELWTPPSIASLLTVSVIDNIRLCFSSLSPPVKLKLLLGMLHLPRRTVDELATVDSEPWVLMVADILKSFPETGSLNLDLEEQNPNVQDILGELREKATETAQQLKKTAGVPFHAKGRGLVKKIDTTTPLKGIPKAPFRSPTAPSLFSPPSNRTPIAPPRTPLRKERGVKSWTWLELEERLRGEERRWVSIKFPSTYPRLDREKNPCPEQGDIIQIKLSEHTEVLPKADGTGSTTMLVDTVEGHSEAQMVLQFPGHDLHAQRKTLLTQAQRTLGNREPEDVQDT